MLCRRWVFVALALGVVALGFAAAQAESPSETTTTAEPPSTTHSGVPTTTHSPPPGPTTTPGPAGPAPPPEDKSYTDGEKFGIAAATWACLAFTWNAACFALSQYYKRHKPKDGPPPLDFFSGTY